MYDTIRLVLERPDVDRVARGLEKAKETCDLETGSLRYTGYLGPLRVQVTPARLSIQGSFARAAGAKAPSRREIADLIAFLSERIETDLTGAHVWRMDVFADFQLREGPSAYLAPLLAKPLFQRYGYSGTSAGFRTKQRTLKFYDVKARERKVHEGTDGPLRYELSWMKRLSKQMNHRVHVRHLLCPIFWDRVISEWVKEYESIEKGRDLLPIHGSFRSLVNLAAASWLRHVGVAEVLEDLKRDKDTGRITAKFYQRRRRQILGFVANETYTVPSSRVKELDQAVYEAADAMRSRA